MLPEPVLAGQADEFRFLGDGLQAGKLLMPQVLVQGLGEELVALHDGSPFVEVSGGKSEALLLLAQPKFAVRLAAAGDRLVAEVREVPKLIRA
jgi:hypothetical protein